MPRGRRRIDLSIAELQQALQERNREARLLQQRRKALLAELAGVDKRLSTLLGSKPAAPRRRVAAGRGRRRAGGTLPDAITKVLAAAGKPMRLRDIAQAVKAAGYKSASRDFYNVVSQALHAKPQFKNVRRGFYRLDASAAGGTATKTAKGAKRRKSRKTAKARSRK
jgi:hypothetical protein